MIKPHAVYQRIYHISRLLFEYYHGDVVDDTNRDGSQSGGDTARPLL